MSSVLCTRLVIKGNKNSIDAFLEQISRKVYYSILEFYYGDITIETYDSFNIECLEKLSKKYSGVDFFQIVYDTRPEQNCWCLKTIMIKNGDIFHFHSWKSPHDPKLLRKNEKDKIKTAFQFMIENLSDQPFCFRSDVVLS